MSDKPLDLFQQLTASPKIILILVGAIVWYLGFFVWWVVGAFFAVAGFGLTCIATIQAAMTKPVTSAFPGLLLGGLIQVAGYYISNFTFVGRVIGFGLVVFGGIMILFYGSSLALQRADIPIVKDLEGFIDSKKKKPAPKKNEKVDDVEEEKEDEESSE
jgi:hypothetical protein